MFKRKLGHTGKYYYVPNNPHFKEKLLGKNNLICYNIERVNIFYAVVGQQSGNVTAADGIIKQFEQ